MRSMIYFIYERQYLKMSNIHVFFQISYEHVVFSLWIDEVGEDIINGNLQVVGMYLLYQSNLHFM